MKKVILLTEDEYNDLLLCVNRILVNVRYLRGYRGTEIKHQTEEIKAILEGENDV